jgi:hypothetical protein|eukprot:scaffold11627_cov267-Chaetoceros_neogracile.AAC.4
MWKLLKRTGVRGSDRSSNNTNNVNNDNDDSSSVRPRRHDEQQNRSSSREPPQSQSLVHESDTDTAALSTSGGAGLRGSPGGKRGINTGRR